METRIVLTEGEKKVVEQGKAFDRAFNNYINAVARFDGIKSGKAVKVANMQYNNAVKQLYKIDAEFAARFIPVAEKQEAEKRQAEAQAAHNKRMAMFDSN